MKKLYFLLLTSLISFASFGQVIITELADPNNNAGARFVEIYCIGPSSVNLNGWELRRWTNSNTDPQTSGVDLSSIGTLNVGQFAIISPNASEFEAVYGFAPDISTSTGGAADSNGDDKIAIFDASDATIDIFGIPGNDVNNANITENFEDGRAERAATVTAPNATWTESEWISDNDQGFGSGAQDAPAGFDPKSWIGAPSSCGVSLGTATFVCTTNTLGDDNDTVTVNIPYTGDDSGITSVSTTSGGAIGGDNPASVTDGTITITGLSEGDAWDITLNGGDCDSTTISGTIGSDICDPACFDLSEGSELFELVTVTANTDNDEWTETNGTYSMNGYCGSGCAENIETWLIFGPLDMTGVTDLNLALNASEQFGTTDLIIAYTSTYANCPSASTWTTSQTITDSGFYDIDLSGISGTEVFIGIQYLDDGADGYSSWSLSNVALEANGNCPTLGTRPTSNCAALSLSKNQIEGFDMYPNPTNLGYVNILSASNDTMTVSVFDLLGKQVLSNTVKNNQLDVSNLKSGIYVMKVSQNDAVSTKKLVIK
ncbi:T9SS type A sorting domain-containing protein [Tamlana sp. 62-3]|uniref:T9SS type A sorting domain-containing protein n=1 Tax=Neotamlana sargassicola TaxID=2883125 RepID=A0A9X1I555_9FLAO|nr:T9SS type A sorting domain-containing protein [Tamlana sargassicola]MCB4807025.1 T9SS type A sorting domain-containing protein [Tamlana sargassicola]